MLEKTFFMIKPDALKRGLTEKIISRLENEGLKFTQSREMNLSPQMAQDLYSPHLGKDFYSGLIKFITSGPVLCCVVEGENAVERVRTLMGATDPRKAEPGTIRFDLREDNVLNEDGIIKNLVHGSDSKESAEREIAVFFAKEVFHEG